MADLEDAARAAQILQSRWQNDPLRQWEPGERQRMFLESKKPEVALLGANRSGKSDALAALVASYARFGNPNPGTAYSSGGRLAVTDRAMSIWVVGLSERLVREGIQPKIVETAYTQAESHKAFIPSCEIAGWNINDQTWKLKNGSLVGFKSADAGADKFQSAGRDLVAFDEICEWDVYKEATFRSPGGGRSLMVRLAATLLPPLGQAGGVSWYYPEKIKPWWAAGNHENSDRNPGRFLDIFSMGIRHNKHIPREEVERLASMFPPGSMEARIRLDGELLASIGGTLAYPAYARAVHFDPYLTPDRMDPRLPLCLCVDFNVSPCVWEIGQHDADCWKFYDEIQMDICNIPSMTEEFRRLYPTWSAPIYIYGDQTGKNRSVQTSTSNYALMHETLRGYPAPIREFLPKRNPFVPDRLNAMNRALSGSDGRVRLLAGPACVELHKDFEEVLRDARGGLKKVHHPEDPYYQRTHATDAVGYAVAFTDPVPQNVAEERPRLRHIPMPGYLGRGGPNASPGARSVNHYPSSYGADGRISRGSSGGILPPRRP
jgi:hypothetical protein